MSKDTSPEFSSGQFWFWILTTNGLWVVASILIMTIYHQWEVGATMIMIAAMYNILSLEAVGPTELGALLLFGRPIRLLGSGLTYSPFGLCRVQRETRLVIQEQYPDNTENVWKGREEDRPKDKMPPIRVTHAGNDESADPLQRRITSEISIIVRYRIKDYLVFLQTIGTISNVRQQVRDIVSAKARAELAKKTPAEALAGWEEINLSLKEAAKQIVSDWGLQVSDVRIEDIDLGRTVNAALRDVPGAELARQARIALAVAEEIEIIERGRGEAEARLAMLQAEASGYKKIAEDLGLEEKEVVLAINLLNTALQSGNQVIISGSDGLSDLLKMVKSVNAAKG